MDERELLNYTERIFAIGIKTGVINTLAELGLIEDNITEKQAFKIYGKPQVLSWREKQWVKAYPSGNKIRSKFYYKRSELETAKLMINLHSHIQPTRIRKWMDL